jgi:hypothetical protein
MSFDIRDLTGRAVRLRKEAAGIREAAMSLSGEEDRELFLQHAAALDREAAYLEVLISPLPSPPSPGEA